jgi:DNA modification methylase
VTWRVEHGDCLDVMRGMADASVDAVVTDPPYGTTQNRWDTPFDLAAWWSQVERIAKPNAAIVAFAQTPFDKVLGASNLRRLRYEWIWRKSNATGHLNAKRAPLKAHENILVFYRKPPHYLPQMRPRTGPRVAHVVRRNGQVNNGRNYGDQNAVTEWEDNDFRYPISILDFAKDREYGEGDDRQHPTRKPVALVAYLLRTYCQPGAVVLDPFTGSGTTGVAAVQEGFRFVGIEREAQYVEIARRRIADAAAQLALPLGVAS